MDEASASWGRPARAPKAGWILLAACELGCALAAAVTWAALHNTLEAGGRFASSKVALEKGVMGAREWFTSRRTLAENELDLGRWHGFQEVLSREPCALSALACSVRLERDAYLVLVFDADERGFSGVRLGNHALYPNVAFRAEPSGAFLWVAALDPTPLEADRWQRVELALEGAEVRVRVEGAERGRAGLGARPALGRFGFRGSLRSARVDDVAAHSPAGLVLAEDFFAGEPFARALSAALAVALAVHAGFLALARGRRAKPRKHRAGGTRAAQRALARRLAALLLGLGALGAGLFAWQRALSRGYAAEDPAKEAAWRERNAARVQSELAARHAQRAAPGTARVLFLGTSQTWGAGAARAEDGLVERCAARLGPRVECINAGLSGFSAPWLADLLPAWIERFGPDLVVLNLGNNDRDPELFARALRDMAELCAARGTDLLLALEANSPEHAPADLPLHAAMRAVAAERALPALDLHAWMRAERGRGLAWWDFVHPTSCGHDLLAERLAPAIETALTLRAGD